MLYRKIETYIEQFLREESKKILVIQGARQIGKSYIIRNIGKRLYKNYLEVNMLEDLLGAGLFADVKTVEDFYVQLSISTGKKMGRKEDTLVFIDEIQEYPQLLTLLKFLKQDDKFTYIASGSLLGVTLSKTTSIPIGSIEVKDMYALDFEEFLIANGFGDVAIEMMLERYERMESLDESVHERVMDLFRKYLLVGGMPDAVNEFIKTKNVQKVRKIQSDIHEFYGLDAAKYDRENKLKIKKLYDILPSNMENKKKRIRMTEIENKRGKRFSDYEDEFDYLISSGVALEVRAISNPKFPLIESSAKNLLKLYLNDVGLLTNILYRHNAMAILRDERSVNLGSVYECVVASELAAHGHKLFYYDNKKHGEVDYLIDDYDILSAVPIEVKSGKDYSTHRALNNFVKHDEYGIKRAYVLSNKREVRVEGKMVYMPVYNVMWL